MSSSEKIKISVIIVNYNVKEYLAHALSSIQRALSDISHEIIVIDNHSIDGSGSYLKEHFPGIDLIENDENLGFGKANNQGIEHARGEFIVLINPDTLVQEDTFKKLQKFFEETPDAAAATCKIINPDGSFSIDCRHSIPTPSIALWKVLGLSKLFPESRIFGKYNMTYLNEDQIYQIPAISGSFMMIRKAILEDIGDFDERFFMYCEDIDLCHRINENGFKIYYVPTTQIIHYKGESTKKDRLDYVITFNKSLYKFFQKYYAPSSLFLFSWLVTVGIFLRGIFIYLKNFFANHFALLLDLLILNGTIMISFIVRLELGRGFRWSEYLDQFWVINVIASLLFLTIALYLDIYPNRRFSIQSIVKANIFTFIFVASLTFFFKQFAYSRIVTLFTFVTSPLLMVSWRLILRRFYRGDQTALGKDLFAKPTLVIGHGESLKLLYQKLSNFKSLDYDLKGWVNVDENKSEPASSDSHYLGRSDDLREIINMFKIRQIIFSAQSLSYEQILKIMSSVRSSAIEFKMVPSNLDVVIGKSHIERLDDYPLLDIGYSLRKRFNRLIKRGIDVTVSGGFLLFMTPFLSTGLLFFKKHYVKLYMESAEGNKFYIYRLKAREKTGFLEIGSLFWHIFKGNLSLVGAPLRPPGMNKQKYLYKAGLTGLVQLNRNKISSPDDEEKFHLYYLKNQSTLLDLEILVKALWQSLRGSESI
jgi:GT2 family glycosyltransferase/lipopolysaccharide/colanic/teichoic acid biosynthesis glycosyltransferase